MLFSPARATCRIFVCALCFFRIAVAQNTGNTGDPVRAELAGMGPRGLAIAAARDKVIDILQSDNKCSAWFRAADPDAAATFASLRFVIDRGPQYILGWRAASGNDLFKHPYAARAPENTGRDSIIMLNANGAFFARSTSVLWRPNSSVFLLPIHSGILQVGSYPGNSLSAQITTLLHELGHVIGRIPTDSDELSGQSDRNTVEVLRFCRAQIKAATRPPRNRAP